MHDTAYLISLGAVNDNIRDIISFNICHLQLVVAVRLTYVFHLFGVL